MPLSLVVDTLEGLPEAVQPLYEKQADGKFKLQVDGIPPPEDTKGLKSALEKERQQREEFEKKLKDFSDVDIEDYRKFQTMAQTNKELGLLKDGKVEELKAYWSENMTKEHNKQLKKVQDEAEQKVTAERNRSSKWLGKVLDNALRSAAEKVGVHPEAIEDVLMHGRILFKIDDDGDAVQLDKDGRTIVGKDGKSALNPEEWLEGLRDKKLHWWPASGTGSGAQPSANAAKGKTMKRSAFDKLNPAERQQALRGGTVIVD